MKHLFRYTAWLVVLALALQCQNKGTTTEAKATLLLLNGNFFTADSLKPQASAMAIAGDRILALGTEAEVRAMAGPNTETMDLKGAFAMPGFIEGHGHFLSLGDSKRKLDLTKAKTWEEIVSRVAAEAK